MAKQTVVQMTDDIDGSKADETVAFTWGGQSYEIDLSNRNKKAFEKAMSLYVGHAQKVRNPRGRAAGTGPAKRDASQSKAIREWARSNGWPDLGDRGRIPNEVEQAYNAS